jgi:hypothetical protein
LIGRLLFETFHHEFFHHLTECAARSFEIVRWPWQAQGDLQQPLGVMLYAFPREFRLQFGGESCFD